jgi:hypothetical protein
LNGEAVQVAVEQRVGVRGLGDREAGSQSANVGVVVRERRRGRRGAGLLQRDRLVVPAQHDAGGVGALGDPGGPSPVRGREVDFAEDPVDEPRVSTPRQPVWGALG